MLTAALSGSEWVSAENLLQQRARVLPAAPRERPVRRCTSFHDYCSQRGKCECNILSGVVLVYVVGLSEHHLAYGVHLSSSVTLQLIPACPSWLPGQLQGRCALHTAQSPCPAHSVCPLAIMPFRKQAAGPSLTMALFPWRGLTPFFLAASEGAAGTFWWDQRQQPCLLCTHHDKRTLRLRRESRSGRGSGRDCTQQVKGEVLLCR